MSFDISTLDANEKLIFELRSLYSQYGYKPFKMSKFEEYDLYSKNKDFLVSDEIITFTDTNGRLMALKPDVTLSIVKSYGNTETGVSKLYYNENVYRVSKGTGSFKEIMQAGLECIGDIDSEQIAEVLLLAAKSLAEIDKSFVLEVSGLGILTSFIERITDSKDVFSAILGCVNEKNIHGIDELLAVNGIDADAADALKKLIACYGKTDEVMPILESLLKENGLEAELDEFKSSLSSLESSEYKNNIIIDFSSVGDVNYYNGIILKGFVNSVSGSVLSGGQYDKLMKRMKRNSKAIGFAVYLDLLDRLDEAVQTDSDRMLNIALPKGRLGNKVYDMFEKAGFECPSIRENNRKLIFENPQLGIRFFWVKPSDVAIYVERGAADIGVAGKDILLEYEPDIYELLDLDIGKCRMAVAAPKGFEDDTRHTLKVATKFSNIAKSYYASIGRDIDIIHLNGSIELAPILKLSDVIVDIVETGTTLKENNLEVINTIVPISARLIANKSSFKFKSEIIEKITAQLKKLTEENND